MLLFTGQIGEMIAINDEVEIVVLSVRGDQIKLGIRASKDIPIEDREFDGAVDKRTVQ